MSQFFGKMVDMPEPMAEWIRVEAFRRRSHKSQLIREALDAYYPAGGSINYKRNGTMTGRVFVRLDAHDSGLLHSYAAKTGQPMNEVIRQAISLMRKKGH